MKLLRVRLVRYADDFIITGSSKELLEKEVKPCVEAFLAERGLQLSQEKTKITHISEGFDFLGQNVRKYDGKLLIKPSAKNVKAFLDSPSCHASCRLDRTVTLRGTEEMTWLGTERSLSSVR